MQKRGERSQAETKFFLWGYPEKCGRIKDNSSGARQWTDNRRELKKAGVKSEKGRLVCEGNREAVGASLWDAYYNEDNLKKYELLLKLREETGHSLQALSLAYLISQPFQVFPIGAVRNTQ